MSEVSRPLQVVLLLTVAVAGLWFVALRPKPDTASSRAPTPTQPARPAPKAPRASSIPGGLGRAVDKAKATKQQGDAQAAAASRTGSAPESGAPTQTASTPAPAPAAQATPSATTPGPAARPHSSGAPPARLHGVTPGTVRRALARGDVVVLLFWAPNS